MKDLIQYHFKLTEALFNFLKDGDEEKLASVWNEVENHARNELGKDPDEGLWIRFFRGDTLVTTLDSILNDYHNPNHDYLIGCINVCVESGEIEVYFS